MRGERSVQSVDRIRFDIVEMAKTIARTKAEIAAIKPDAEHQGKFGEATEELDSIVQATETATSDILAAAEQIQEVAWTLREQGLEAEVCDCSTPRRPIVYTACSFQDLTGQRTSKVINVLRYLEDRINAMIRIWGLDGAMAAEAAERETVRDGDKALLNGPALPGHGLDQTDVDVVMGPADTASAAPAAGRGARAGRAARARSLPQARSRTGREPSSRATVEAEPRRRPNPRCRGGAAGDWLRRSATATREPVEPEPVGPPLQPAMESPPAPSRSRHRGAPGREAAFRRTTRSPRSRR